MPQGNKYARSQDSSPLDIAAKCGGVRTERLKGTPISSARELSMEEWPSHAARRTRPRQLMPDMTPPTPQSRTTIVCLDSEDESAPRRKRKWRELVGCPGVMPSVRPVVTAQRSFG